MTEPASPALPVFRKGTLPGDDPAQPVTWPEDIHGIPLMPMSGTYIVEFFDGSQAVHTDGFLSRRPDGHPQWTQTAEFP